jgi:hypothetical protein
MTYASGCWPLVLTLKLVPKLSAARRLQQHAVALAMRVWPATRKASVEPAGEYTGNAESSEPPSAYAHLLFSTTCCMHLS